MKKLISFLSVTALVLLFCSQQARAQKVDYRFASLFMYNFTNYIEWPEPANSRANFVIGVIGDKHAVEALQVMASTKKANRTKPFVIKSITDLKEVGTCQMVFLTTKESIRVKEVIAAIGKQPVLLVSEKEGMAKKGVNINLFLDDNDGMKTKFELNKKLAQAQGFKVAGQLEALAVIVE